jgi:hypothetical protein
MQEGMTLPAMGIKKMVRLLLKARGDGVQRGNEFEDEEKREARRFSQRQAYLGYTRMGLGLYGDMLICDIARVVIPYQDGSSGARLIIPRFHFVSAKHFSIKQYRYTFRVFMGIW